MQKNTQTVPKMTLVVHNVRSAYNVGALFRTADGIGVDSIYLTGYSPIPAKADDFYLSKPQKMIAKTALGAEQSVRWHYKKNITSVIEKLREEGAEILALEQHPKSLVYSEYRARKDFALIVGNEPRGISTRTLEKCDTILEIPMHGAKNSLNVAIAFGIIGYHLRLK